MPRFALITFLLASSAVLTPRVVLAQLPSPGSTYHILFASSWLFEITPNQSFPPTGMAFGNIKGADWQMTYAAVNAGLPGATGWDGNALLYHSLLSVLGDNLRDRVVIEGPVFNSHTTLLADSKSDLLDGSIKAPVDYDEFGIYIEFDPDVWTGSSSFGAWFTNSCGNWNNPALAGQVGDAFVADSAWLTAGFTKSGAQTSRLYGISSPLTAPAWGDFDNDNDDFVDGNDFLSWQRGETSVADTAAYNFWGLGTSEGRLNLWKLYFGQAATPPFNAVPEPSAIALSLLASSVVTLVRRHR